MSKSEVLKQNGNCALSSTDVCVSTLILHILMIDNTKVEINQIKKSINKSRILWQMHNCYLSVRTLKRSDHISKTDVIDNDDVTTRG